jgi:pimeloyl-ACP methyl ester carboxylesterase
LRFGAFDEVVTSPYQGLAPAFGAATEHRRRRWCEFVARYVGPVSGAHGSRLRRWARRIALAVLALAVAVTLAAVGFDLATAGDSRPARQLYGGPFVQVGDTLAAYRRWGSSGTPVLLLGGAAEPSWVWHEVGPLLAAHHHRVFALDLPPFGYTERRGPYTMAGWLALVRGFERRVGVTRPVIVGHSLGAGVAAADALADPSAVAGVVLLDGDALPFGHGRAWLSTLLVYPYYPALYRILTGSDWLVSRVLANAWGPHRPRFGHALLANFERPFRVDGTAGALRRLAGGGLPGVSDAGLRRLRVPRAVVWGADDTVDSVASGHAAASALHVRLDLIPGAGHLSMLARPAAVAAAIERVASDKK